MEKVFAVYRDGFRVSEFANLEETRAFFAEYRKCKDFYNLSIYRKNDSGSITFVE